MKRSEINTVIREAAAFFSQNSWVLPPNPKWDVTDFGLGDFSKNGLVLINLAEEKEYCEKLMYAKKGMTTPTHAHTVKKEDIIVRTGQLSIQIWKGKPENNKNKFTLNINGQETEVTSGEVLELNAGERITIVPGIYHMFFPISDECIIGEVSTANNDSNDNFFIDPQIGRYSVIEEDEAPLLPLIGDQLNE